jgi:hypothetical protein
LLTIRVAGTPSADRDDGLGVVCDETECSDGIADPAFSGLDSDLKQLTGETAVSSFYVDDENVIHAAAVSMDTTGRHAAFASLDELMEVVAAWPLRRLVEVWNKLPGVHPVTRFEDRQVAVRRIWRALTGVSSPPSAPAGRKPHSTRRLNKTELVLKMLRQPQGATLKALMRATKWQAHSVRGVPQREGSKGSRAGSAVRRRDGERVYALPPTRES